MSERKQISAADIALAPAGQAAADLLDAKMKRRRRIGFKLGRPGERKIHEP